jgi:hypothetical protein
MASSSISLRDMGVEEVRSQESEWRQRGVERFTEENENRILVTLRITV